MATASVPVEADDKECPVCHELFADPKLLPCGHLLCRHCLISWLQSKAQAHCPLCRCVIVDPEERTGGKSLENIADGFPTDLAMAALVESQQLLSKDHPCESCVTETATSICLNCNCFLCSNCAAGHKRLPVSRHHTVEELSSLTADKLAASRPSFCAVHADEISKVYCPTHGASICWQCATIDHRQCPEVTRLETKVEEARAVLAELAATLSGGETELERAISQMDQHLRDTEKRTRAAIAEIEAMCDRLESAVKECRRRMKELALGACSDVKEAVEEGKTCLLKRRGKLTSHQTVIQRVQGIPTGEAVYGMTSPMTTRVKELDCSATLPVDAKVISKVTFVIDPEAVSRVERELLELGQLKVVPADVAANVKVKLGQLKVVPADVAANVKVKRSLYELVLSFTEIGI